MARCRVVGTAVRGAALAPVRKLIRAVSCGSSNSRSSQAGSSVAVAMTGGLVVMCEPAIAVSLRPADTRSRQSVSAQSTTTKAASSETTLGQTALAQSTLRRAHSVLAVRVTSAVPCSHIASARQAWASGAVVAGSRRSGSSKARLVVVDVRALGARGERVVDGTSRCMGLGVCTVVIRTSGASDGVVHAAAYGLVAVQGAVTASTPSRSVVADAVTVGSPVGQRRDVLPCANG